MDLVGFRKQLLGAMGYSPALAGAALVGCAEVEPLDLTPSGELEALPEDTFAFPDQPLPPPTTMTLATSNASSGRVMTVNVAGAQPGDVVHVFWSIRQGRSCPPVLQGGCIDLYNPKVLAQAPANARGELNLSVQVPQVPAGSGVFFQAVVASGPYASPVARVVVDPLPEMCDASLYEVLTPTTVGNNFEWLVCAEVPAGGCPAQPNQAQTNWMFEQASQANAGGFGYQVSALCHEDTYANQCCYVMDGYFIAIGRPLTTTDGPRAASLRPGGAWVGEVAIAPADLPAEVRELIAARWRSQARDEHASVAAFARFTLQLMALGAPPELIASATRAQGDEVRHALACFGVASQYAGVEISAGKLDLAGVLDEGFDAASVLVGTIREGCVNETVAAAQARMAAEACVDPSLSALLHQIADDEGRHSALAWSTVRWLLAEHPELSELAQQTFARALELPVPPADQHHDALRAHGVTPYDELYLLGLQVASVVIEPCAAALFQASPNASAEA